jgi:hypothetical protein
MTTVNLSLFAGVGAQLFDNNGVPLSGGLVYSYFAGTTTPATTYTSSSGSVANTNPIVLDSAGRVANEIWAVPGQTYKFIVKTSVATQIGSYDNVPVANDSTAIYAALASTASISTGAGLIGFKAENDGALIPNAVGTTVEIKLSEMVSVEDFGAVGDGVTDDTAAIQAAVNWSIANQKAIYLQDKQYYVTSTINCSDLPSVCAIIRSFSNNPCGADPYFYNPGGTGSYYFNTGTNATAPWSGMITATAYTGAGIISDYNGPILQVSNGARWNISGVGIIGYHRQPQQIGMYYAATPAVNNSFGDITNVNVVGCGNSGIYFSCGTQEGVFTNVVCNFNNGDGITVTNTAGASSPVDSNYFNNCRFQFNRTNGAYFSYVTKHLFFTGCDFSGNGQYNEAPSSNYIDPLLGYDRTPPTNSGNMAAAIWINDGDISNQGGEIFNVNILNCTGEEIAVGLHLVATSGNASLQFLDIQNTCFYKSPIFPYNGGQVGAVIWLGVGVLANSRAAQIYQQALQYITFSGNTPPAQIAGNNYSNLFTDSNVTSGYTSAAALQNFLAFNFNKPFLNTYRTYGTQWVAGNPLTSGTQLYLAGGGNITTSSIANDLTLGTGGNQSTYTASYVITCGSNSSTGSTTVGTYLIVVYLIQSQYSLTYLAMSSTSGFTGPPTINSTTGVLTIPAASGNYYFSIVRLDNNLTNIVP